jgi:hypothetical protein
MKSLKLALGVLIFSTALAAPGCKSTAVTEDAPERVLRVPALGAAHVAFLEGDHLTMVKRVRDVLLDKDADPIAKDNARELLEKGYEVTSGNLPADWSMPPGFEPITYKQERTEHADGTRYGLRLEGRVDDPHRMKNISLLRGDTVLMDREAHVGRYLDYAMNDGVFYYTLETRNQAAFPEPGVMTLRITLADGSVSEGWFISDRLAASASPVITEPGDSDSLKSAHPTVKWVPFRSPENVPYEGRSLVLWLSRREDDGTYSTPWVSPDGSPDQSEVQLGVGATGGPPLFSRKDVDLPNGDYELDVIYAESRRFGPMWLKRKSTRALSFHIAR